QCSSMVVPMPTAFPWTAAISGLDALPRLLMKRNAGVSSSLLLPDWAAKSARSLPAVKLSPSPWNRTTLMDGSVSARSTASDSTWYMALVRAFFLSGRCSVRIRIPFSTSIFTCSLMEFSFSSSGSGDRACALGRSGDPVEKSRQAFANEALGVRHNSVDQLLDGWDAIDQPDHHAAAPSAGIHVAVDHHLGIDACHLVPDIVDLEAAPLLTLLFEQALDARIVQNTLGVAQRTHHQPGIQLRCRDDRLLHILMDRCLLRRNEARSHVHAGRAERERGHETTRIRHAAGRHEGNLEFVRCARQQDHVRHVVFAGMAAALEAVDAHRIAANLLGLQGVTDRSAFVDHLDAGGLQ